MDAETAWAILERVRNLHGVGVRNVLSCKNDERAYLGLASSNAVRWEKQETLMYIEEQLETHADSKQISLTADPSLHAGEDTMIGIVWNRRSKNASVGISVMPAGKFCNPDDVDMIDTVVALNDERKITRRAAYKEMQGMFHVAHLLTGRTPADFNTPVGVTLRPAREGEARITEEEHGNTIAFLDNLDTNEVIRDS